MRIFRTAAAAAVVAAVACAAMACSGGPTSKAAMPTGRTTVGTAFYYGQRIDWKACGTGFQCGTVQAPLNYADPGGRRVKLAVIRLPAEGARTGSLVTNPGGPGGSGVEFIREAGHSFGPEVRKHFDIVGFDPRGVGGSEPAVHCVDGKVLDRYFATDTTPDNAAEQNNIVSISKEIATACQRRDAGILPYMGTVNAAHDIDVLRAALGDQTLTYYGASYGTYLGAFYAQQFPTKIRTMVLDGAIDPKSSAAQMNLEQGKGFDVALRAFAADCVKSPACPIGHGSVDAALRRVGALLAQADRSPLKNGLGDGRQVDEPLVQLGIAFALYNKQSWPTLQLALKSAIEQGDGTLLLRLGDLLSERRKDGSYSNENEANMAVNCVDKPYPRTLGPWRTEATQAKKAAPFFGQFVVWGTLPCAFWPTRQAPAPRAITASGAPPIVVVGTTRDPATPYKWAQALAGELKSGVLLTLDGDGHTAYLQGNPCITSAVDRYLVEATPPKKGTTCH